MRPEQEPSATNWNLFLLQKLNDVEEGAIKKFEEQIPKDFKIHFQKEPENIRSFVVLLSLLNDKERQQLTEDYKAGKVRNHMVGGHKLGNCLTLYDIFSGKILPKETEVI